MNSRGVILFTILLVLPIMLQMNECTFTQYQITNESESIFLPSDLSMHEPIVITNPTDFTTLGFTGNGTLISPFLIEGLQIDSAGGPCISLTGLTDLHFEIKSCRLSGARGSTMIDASVYFDSGIGAIEQCEFHNSTIGTASNNVSITVTNSSFSEIYETSIWGVNNTDSTFTQNSFMSNGTSMLLLNDAMHITIESNIFNSSTEMNVTHQIALLNCSDIDIVHNYLSSHSTYETISCESITDLFLFNNTFALSSGKGAFITGDGVHIENCTFTYIGPKTFSHYPRSLMLGGSSFADKISTDYRVINCTFQDLAIVSSRVNDLNVSLCRFIDIEGVQNAHFFISKSEFSSTSIYKNTFINCSLSIDIDRTVSDVMMNNNSFIECDDGVLALANRTSIINNTFIGSATEYRSAVRTSPDFGRNITIAFNHIEGFHYGLNIQGHDAFIYNNSITNNRIGVFLLSTSSNNSVYYNRFYDNIQHAEDDGESNVWDDTVSQGNWWDDYQGDGTYAIPGSAWTVDRYPSGPSLPTTPSTTSTIPSTTTQTDPTTPTSPTTTPSPIDTMMIGIISGATIIVVALVVIVRKRGS